MTPKDALEFYADPRRYQGANQRPIEGDKFAKPDAVYIQDVTRDNGDIARRALATITTPAPGREELARIAKEAREAAAVLSVERVQGWANPLVTAIVKAADALDELAGNGKPAMDAGAPDVVLSALWPERDALRQRIAQESWHDLVEKNDRTSPEEYPDTALITFDELAGYIDDAILSALPVAPVVDGWRNADDIPPVPKGQMREYVVAVKRAKTGKAYEFAACYLNGYPIEYRDCCPKGDGCDGDGCDDGCPTTGWFEQTGDDYYDTMFNQMSIGKDDTFLGWRELPRWEDRAAAPVVDEAAIRADEREKQRHASWRLAHKLTKKWGNPNGTQYEQGAQDHGVRIAQAIRAGGCKDE